MLIPSLEVSAYWAVPLTMVTGQESRAYRFNDGRAVVEWIGNVSIQGV